MLIWLYLIIKVLSGGYYLLTLYFNFYILISRLPRRSQPLEKHLGLGVAPRNDMAH